MVWDQSLAGRVLVAATKRLSQVSDGSVVVGAAKSITSRVEAVIRRSYCYRWLTAEPDPSVIVIDLRETRTVGPFVGLLERVVELIERVWTNSALKSATATAGSALSDSRTGQLLGALLEPPKPPENGQQLKDDDAER